MIALPSIRAFAMLMGFWSSWMQFGDSVYTSRIGSSHSVVKFFLPTKWVVSVGSSELCRCLLSIS